MKKFMTGGYGKVIIKEVEVEKETACFVWIKGHRNKKDTNYMKYFDTWDEAKLHLVSKANKRLEGLNHQVIQAEIELKSKQSLQPGD